MSQVADYGGWNSSLTAEKLAKKGLRYGHMCVDQENLYWLESRAKEQGRGVIVKCSKEGRLTEALPKDVSVRSKVHEYGSGDFIVDQDKIYFSNAKQQSVYCYDGQLTQLTEPVEKEERRYADYSISPDKKYLVCVRETHRADEVVNELVRIDLSVTNKDQASYRPETVLHRGFDFYSSPRISQQGHRICWTCWDQPDMPWDAAELWVADFHQQGDIDAAHKVYGGRAQDTPKSSRLDRFVTGNSSIYQPTWSGDGVLHFISDVSGWSNIYSCRDGVLNALAPIDREFGIPQWSLASSTYVITTDNQIYAVYLEQGQQQLCHIDGKTGHSEPIELPFKNFGEHLVLAGEFLYFRASSPAKEEAVYSFNLTTQNVSQLSKQNQFPLPVDELSIAQSIQFETSQQRSCFAFYYPPQNASFAAPDGAKPPLIVMSHGGPTAMTNNSLNSAVQYWTNRGFAVVDVNYGGSTGFGKNYRNQLIGHWGIVDVEDCVAAAEYLVKQGLADGEKLLIRGGSAGGYTTLCALTFTDVFAAGMSRYGVADLESLAADSHKFEARYLDSMVGAYPQEKERYQARSPIHFTEKLSCPILLLQGADDKVVPPNQTEMMVESLQEKKIPYAYKLYQGEGHGFRKSETIIDALESELSFYRQILEISDCEDLPILEITNFAGEN